MLLHHLKLAIRFFIRKRTSSFLNLSSLVTGLLSFLFIALFVFDELTYDRHNVHYNTIYRITTSVASNDFYGVTAATSVKLAATLRQNFPEKFHTVARYIPYGINAKVTYGHNIHRIEHVYMADQQALDIFTYHFLAGNPHQALTGTHKIVLTESTAKRIFGTLPAIGKTVSIDQVSYEVTGVIENLPSNSDMPINGLISLNFGTPGDWSDWKAYTYVRLDQHTSPDELLTILGQVQRQYVTPSLRATQTDIRTEFRMQALQDIHFVNDLYNDTPKGNRTYVYFLSVAGILLLLIACFNYINLSVARSLERGVEVGVRKVLGAHQAQLVRQYLMESLVMTGLALIMALVLLAVLLPLLNGFTGKHLSVFSLCSREMSAVILFVFVVVGILSSLYPSWYLSSFAPEKILKGKITFSGGGMFKDALMVIQFAVSMGMVICTSLVSGQLNYLKNRDTGFQRENVLIIRLPEDVAYSRVTTLKSEFERLSAVEDVSVVGFGSRPGSGDTEKEFFLVEQNNQMVKRTVNCIFVDEAFLDVLKIKLAAGSRFTAKNTSTESFLVNETFVKQMGWDNPIGKKIVWQEEGEVIGVVKDYNYQSLYNKIEPLILIGYSATSREMLVKIKNPKDIDLLQEKWREVMEGGVFDFSFLDQNLELQYRNDEKMLHLFAAFSFLTALLAFIGLFALSYLHIRQKTKEIGIRKVLGATHADLVYLFTRKTLRLVCLSFLIAAPLTAYLVHSWSRNFIYRKEISLWTFVFSGFLMLLLALVTAGYSVFKAANHNPVDSLRSE